jgi:hypothetical protein
MSDDFPSSRERVEIIAELIWGALRHIPPNPGLSAMCG